MPEGRGIAAFFMMNNYWDELGDVLDKQEDISKPFADRQHSDAEQRYVNEPRDYYAAASKGSKGHFEGSAKSEADLKRMRGLYPVIGAALTPVMGARFTMPAIYTAIKKRSIVPLAIPAAMFVLGGAAFGGFSLYDKYKGRYYATPKTKAKKYTRFSDEQLQSMLRGGTIKEEVKAKEHYIK